jgi:hypothetical protein
MNTKFSLGDVLVMKTVYGEEHFNAIDSKVELMENSILPQRYLVIHVDENTNISFLKKIKMDGKLDTNVSSTIDFDLLISWSNFSYYEVDPYFTDATIFGEQFDVSSILKEETDRRSRIININKAAATEIKSLRDAEKFIKELKSGEKFYFHSADKDGYHSNDKATFEFNKMRKYSLESRLNIREWKMNTLNKHQINSKYVYTLRSKNGSLLRSSHLVGMAMFKVEPMSLNETE